MPRSKSPRPAPTPGIDWSAVRTAWGVALLVGGSGALIVYATLTAPPGPAKGTASRAIHVTSGLVQRLPTTVVSQLALGFGVLMMAFALFAVVLGLKEFTNRRR